MKFQIVRNNIKDSSITSLIIKMFEYMSSLYNERAEEALKTKNKTKLHEILKNICLYVESGLINKLSYNYCVFISENPHYALKYDNKYLMIIKYNNYEIVILLTPYICIAVRFTKKKIEENEKDEIENFYTKK